MQITIHKDGSAIIFEYLKEEESRFFRIESEILHAVSYLNSRMIHRGMRVLSQDPLRNFTPENQNKVVEILKGYCLTPTFV